MLKSGFLFGNICGLYPKSNKTKVDYLSDSAFIEGANILCLTESHLLDEIKDCEVKILGYDIHRSDRVRTSHGGVVIYTKTELKAIKLNEWNNAQCEIVSVLIKELKVLIICIYRPPVSGTTDTFEEVIDTLQLIIDDNANENQIVVCGDLNFPFVQWPDGNFSG